MTEKTARQIENMKTSTFGVELEMNSITRKQAAKTVAAYLGTRSIYYVGGPYSAWEVTDLQGRTWSFQRDSSIQGPDELRCEMVTPVLHYNDMETLQEITRQLRHAGGQSCSSRGCGVHVHISGEGHTPQSIRRLVNLMASHEDELIKAIEIGRRRQERYCQTVDPDFLRRLNSMKPQTTEELARCWYNGPTETDHYSLTRYRMLNLHSYFNRYHTIEFRCFNFDEESENRKGGLNAGQLKAMIQLCLALSQMAKQIKTASPKKGQRDNEAFHFRCWMLRLGFIGDEFKTAREYFMRNFTGSCAWRHAT